MGWGASVFPLSTFDDDESWAWLAGVVVGQMPAARPADPGRPLPTVRDVLRVLRDAGCQGDGWFTLDRSESASLDGVPAHGSRPELDLGGVSLHIVDEKVPEGSPAEIRAAYERPLAADGPVDGITFSKPHPNAVLRAAGAMSALWGQVVAMEHSGCESVIVSPGEALESVCARTPWAT